MCGMTTSVSEAFPGRRRTTFAAAQVAIIVGLAGYLFTGSSDPTATTIDWGFVTYCVVAPLTLAVSFVTGWFLARRSGPIHSAVTRYFVGFPQVATLVLLVGTAVAAPFMILVSVTIEPIG